MLLPAAPSLYRRLCAEEQRNETIGERGKKKKRHAEKRCGKAEQIKQSSDLLGFVLAKNAPCILIRSAVQLALTALLMPFRRSELSLFNTSVFLFQDFFFFACLIAESAAGGKGEARGGKTGAPTLGAPACASRQPAASPMHFLGAGGVHLF